MKRPVDLGLVKQARTNLDRIAEEHPELTSGDSPHRLSRDLEDLLKMGRNNTFTTTEAAEILRCSREHLRRLIRTSKLKAGRTGKEYTISGADLEVYYQAKGGGRLFSK